MSLVISLLANVCPECSRGEYVYSANTTHSLGRMAKALGIYNCLWWPDEAGILCAADLVPHLERAIEEMYLDPSRFRAFNSPDGHGDFNNFLPWLSDLLEACKDNPNATVRASR